MSYDSRLRRLYKKRARIDAKITAIRTWQRRDFLIGSALNRPLPGSEQ